MVPIIAPRACSIIYGLCRAHMPADAVVLLPANVCPTVPLAVFAAGRSFEFIDLDPSHWDMSEDKVDQRLKDQSAQKVGILIYVRTYGALRDSTPAFMKWKRLMDVNAILIDDRCLCFPETNLNYLPFSGADVVLYSNGYAKPVDLKGGGYAFLDKNLLPISWPEQYQTSANHAVEELYKGYIKRREVLNLQEMALTKDIECVTSGEWLGGASKFSSWKDYRDRIEELKPHIKKHKEKINKVYQEKLPSNVTLSEPYHQWRFQVLVEKRDKCLAKIFDNGLFASAHYYPSSDLFSFISQPFAQQLYSCIINLFNDYHFDTEKAEKVCDLINAHLMETEKMFS